MCLLVHTYPCTFLACVDWRIILAGAWPHEPLLFYSRTCIASVRSSKGFHLPLPRLPVLIILCLANPPSAAGCDVRVLQLKLLVCTVRMRLRCGPPMCACWQDDGLSMGDMETILDSFQGQSLDFFGALRSATYDNQIRSWIKGIVKGDIDADGANLQELSRRLINRCAANTQYWTGTELPSDTMT